MKIMTNIEMKEISKVAAEFYKANRQDFITDLSVHIEKRIKSGLAQFKNGQYMGIEDSEQQLKNELFPNDS